jgi:uncharacterized membrane protein
MPQPTTPSSGSSVAVDVTDSLRTLPDPLAASARGGLTRGGARRLDSIDMLRGLVIALMVLDHVRDFFHFDAFLFDPTDPTKTTPLLFATRWITHLCAPTFVFLSGVSIFLQRANGKTGAALSGFLITRGLWLIVLEVTLITFGFNFGPPIVFLQVIWAIGIGMVLMAALVRVSPTWVLALGVVIVAGHGLLGGIDAADFGSLGFLWQMTMEPGVPSFAPGLIIYPAIPWFGIMCLGYGLGGVFLQAPEQRKRSVLILATSAIALFLVLRAFTPFGDPSPWRAQLAGVPSVLSFFNVSKYPPSLLYVLITLGVSLLLSLAFERLRTWPAQVLLAFGRTPLATYLLHIYVVHGLACVVGMAMGFSAADFARFLEINFFARNAHLVSVGWGFNLAVVYVVWAAVLAALYPVSAWVARLKRERRDWWLSYV